ncbi:MAG: hypothetical protein GQ523_00550 [Methanophagales archaeon]|nr:hypothetical protein [Methanophagales archaeon]
MKKNNNPDDGAGWKNDRSKELYGIDNWGSGYFDINRKGNLLVKPDKSKHEVEILQVIEYLKKNRIKPPVLLRFPQFIFHFFLFSPPKFSICFSYINLYDIMMLDA